MSKFVFEGKEIQAVGSEDWRADELAEAENALKIDAGEARFAEKLQLTFFISRKRADPSAMTHVVADQAKSLKLGSLIEEEESGEGPLVADPAPETSDTGVPPTTGPRRLEASA